MMIFNKDFYNSDKFTINPSINIKNNKCKSQNKKTLPILKKQKNHKITRS